MFFNLLKGDFNNLRSVGDHKLPKALQQGQLQAKELSARMLASSVVSQSQWHPWRSRGRD